MSLLALLDYASVFIFALTGALVASRAQLDLVGFAFLAALTGIGGGTLRDVLLDRNPIFWIEHPTYLAITSLAAALIFLTAHSGGKPLSPADLARRFGAWGGRRSRTWRRNSACTPSHNLGVDGHRNGLHGRFDARCGLQRSALGVKTRRALRQRRFRRCRFGRYRGLAWGAIHGRFGAAMGVTLILRAGSLAFGWRLPIYKHEPPKN